MAARGTGGVPATASTRGAREGWYTRRRRTSHRARPPFTFDARYYDVRRKAALPRAYETTYAAPFGVKPMILTPEPRATSIAWITSWYVASDSPLMKITLSGRSV